MFSIERLIQDFNSIDYELEDFLIYLCLIEIKASYFFFAKSYHIYYMVISILRNI